MSTQVPSFLRGLIDDAAIYPPGELPLADAVRAHAAYRTDPRLTAVVGPLVLPTTALRDADSFAEDLDLPIDVALITESGVRPALEDVSLRRHLEAVSLEVPTGASGARDAIAAVRRARAEIDASAGEGTYGTSEVFVEPGWAAIEEDARGVIEAVAAARTSLKLRTGGLRASAFPSETRLASAIHSTHAQGVAFKCTAGLHHAIRHRDETTGFEHHGFLNVLWGAAIATQGGTSDDIAHALGVSDAESVASAIHHLAAADTAVARVLFVSFGSCSITEPLDDLRPLGLLAAEMMS